MDTQRIHPYENRAVLKEYYAKYLKDVRKVSDSTVKHYFDALNNISRYGFEGTVSVEGNTIQRSRFH